jgi:cardiolipin synthase
MQRRVWKFQVSTWLAFFVMTSGLAAFCGFFFVRRELVQYKVGHTFGVRDTAFFASAHALGDPLPIPGNKITLLQNGDEIFPEMLRAIRSARESVNFEAYIFHSGKVGRKFMDAFEEKAKSGVKVRLLLDGVGSSTKLDNNDVKELEKSGCRVAYFHPTRSLRIDRANRRTHRRLMIVDGKLGYTGSVGFDDLWSGNADSADHWRDMHARIEGPLVGKLQGAFQQHWAMETHEALTGKGQFPELSSAGSLRAQMTASHDYSIAPLALTQAVAIAAAEKNIFITNPYCTPSEALKKVLLDAARRGVDVEILVPGKHNDVPATKAAGRSAYGDLLEGGVKIFEYEPTMIHTKSLVVDGMFALFGTSNLDARSSEINEELDISVYDEAFSEELEKIFRKDLAKSKPYTLVQFKQRSLWERVSEWLTIPFRSQM